MELEDAPVLWEGVTTPVEVRVIVSCTMSDCTPLDGTATVSRTRGACLFRLSDGVSVWADVKGFARFGSYRRLMCFCFVSQQKFRLEIFLDDDMTVGSEVSIKAIDGSNHIGTIRSLSTSCPYVPSPVIPSLQVEVPLFDSYVHQLYSFWLQIVWREIVCSAT